MYAHRDENPVMVYSGNAPAATCCTAEDGFARPAGFAKMRFCFLVKDSI